MSGSVIFEIISMLKCFLSSGWNLNVPTKDVRFGQLEFECPHNECKALSFCNHFNTKLSSSVGN